MFGNIQSTILTDNPKETDAIIELIQIASEIETYKNFLDVNSNKIENYENRKSILKSGMFSGSDFVDLVMAAGKFGGTNPQLLSHFLKKLCDWMLISDHNILSPSHIAPFRWDRPRIRAYLSLNIIDNILLGATHIAKKYSRSVPPIIVNKEGDTFTGTGFLVGDPNFSGNFAVVTAAHNVNKKEGIRVQSIGHEQQSYLPLLQDWIIHPSLDVAVMPIKPPEERVPIWPLGEPAVLGKTVTLGYPRIATTDRAYLLAHSGELNAIVNSYYGEERLIISNLVAPGNSGGPVLDEAGLCVGMVVNSLETEHSGGKNTANSAIPARAILGFCLPILVGGSA